MTVLSAGGTVARAASEARGTFPNVDDTTRPTTRRRLCPADEQPQCRVVRALRLALGQRLTLDRPEPRATPRIDDRDNDLQAAGRVEHDPVKHGTAAGDVHEVAYSELLHNPSLSRRKRAPRDCTGTIKSGAPVLWTDRRYATQTAADRTRSGKSSGRRSPRQRSAAASRCPRVRSRGPTGRRRARTVSCRTLRFASRWLASRPPGHRRFSRGRAMGEVCATSCTDGRRRSHRPCWDRRADPAASRPAHRRSAASRTDRLPRRSARRPYRSRAEMRCSDTRPLAPGAQLCRQGSLTRASRTSRGSLFAGWLIDSAAR